ncbi:GNAT family N-acetyltransferase [Indiicoccus explosivorum]|uniref:GNAT family N-acetyltransferase n=1 Tax=Indiicoccus explosivorum TaxID=1917864 RepID=UPI000B42FA5E|nr:GNAT family protein [Indiicoccus explosivorum]
MEFEFREMSQEEAEEIAFGWHYDGVYAFYDVEADEEDLAEFLDPAERDGTVFAGHSIHGLSGFFSISQVNNEAIEIGLGLRPDLTGQGIGAAFVEEGLSFAKKQFCFSRVTLSVASFNQRAIRLYKKMGFIRETTFLQKTNGGEYEFVKMQKKLQDFICSGKQELRGCFLDGDRKKEGR